MMIRIWSLGVIIVGAVWIRRRAFTVEIEGEPPFTTVRGRLAVVAGIVVVWAGVILLAWPKILV